MPAKPQSKVEVNSFVKGLITEASPLNFPADATIDEQNFVLNKNGRRDRRLGMDVEDGGTLFDTNIDPEDLINSGIKSFSWKNAGGVAENEFAVIQLGNYLHFFDVNKESISSQGYKGFITLQADPKEQYSFSSVNGYLIVATRGEELVVVEYSQGVFSSTTERLLIRDLFGVEDRYDTTVLGTVSGIATPIYFESVVQTMRADTSAFDIFSTMSPGDFVNVSGTGSNNRTFVFQSYNPTTHTVTFSGGVVRETVNYSSYTQEVTVITGVGDGDGWRTETQTFYDLAASKVVLTLYSSANLSRNLGEGQDVSFRPPVSVPAHTYNLQNQGWGIPRRQKGVGLTDPVNTFLSIYGKYPSNTDQVWEGLHFDANSGNPIETFFPNLVTESSKGATPSAKGYFIIDALRRGDGRITAHNKNKQNYTELSQSVSSIPSDITPGGPSVITEYSGRVFYAGFSEEVIDGDANSPTLSSYILFSRLVRTTSDIFKCYQDGDPTSREFGDLLDTDGGFVRIAGAKKVIAMEVLYDALIIVADNGVWLLKGEDNGGFKATGYLAQKLSSYGAVSTRSIVVDGSNLYFWSEDGIYIVTRNQFGDFEVSNTTEDTIKTYYEEIPATDKEGAIGIYDPFDRNVRWLYGMNRNLISPSTVKELVFDVVIGAFYPSVIFNLETGSPQIVEAVRTGAFVSTTRNDFLYVDADPLFVGSDPLYVEESVRSTGLKSVKYVFIANVNGVIRFSFAEYKNDSFRDWETVDGVGVDAPAYLITGAVTGGDSSVHKQVPYLVMHFLRTESGMVLEDGVLVPDKQSSCYVRSQWDWASSSNSNKWSPQFQAYRYRRGYIPGDVNDPFDNGFEVVTTKNKVRGRGRAFAFRMDTTPERDCRILGWSLVVNGNRFT